MKKSDWQYVVDSLLFLCIVGITLIGFLMGLFLPKGPQAPESAKYFLGLHRHQWGNIHFYLSIAFVTFVIIHLVLSWKWIKGKASQLFKKGWGVMLGSTATASLLVLFLFWILYPKVPGAYEDHGTRARAKAKQQELMEEGYPHPEEIVFYEEGEKKIIITGQTTLRELENVSGIPVKEIAIQLGVPSKVSPDESLGRLRKKYLLSIQDARDIISRLLTHPEKAPQKMPQEETQKTETPEEQVKKEEAEHEEKLTRGRMTEDPSGILITGQMTLLDIENNTGIPARKIADKLGLPQNSDLNERLGRLRKRYLFTMQDVRDAIASLMKKNEEGNRNG